MKKTILILFLLSASFLLGQIKKVDKSVAVSTTETKQIKPMPIDTHPNLIKLENEIAAMVQANPKALSANKINKITADYSVGDTKNLWTYDLENGTFYQTPSTCRGVGTYCDVFVEDSVWEGGRVTQTAVDNVIDAFDNSTPGNSEKGIFETVTGVYGECPDVDNDNKIIILILNIKDGYTPSSGSYTAGYFYSVNEYSQEYLNENGGSSYKTNEAEIFYMDCNPATLTTESGLDDVLATTAHEFQHMVHWNYHGNPDVSSTAQETFFNEGCSQLAPYLCGYGLPEVASYLNSTNNIALTGWNSGSSDVLIDYARSSLYFLYLYEQFGQDFITDFVQSSYTGSTAINLALSGIGETRTYTTLFTDWVIANALNDKTLDPKWGYDSADFTELAEGDIKYSVQATDTIDVYSFAAQYITYVEGDTLNATLSLPSGKSYPKFKVIEISDSSGIPNKVVDVASGETFTEPNFGSTYSSIKIVAYNTSLTTQQFYLSSSGSGLSGTIEMEYDSAYESDYYSPDFTTGTKQAVVFSGIDGGTLYSIKAKLRTTEPIKAQVFKYSSSAVLGDALTEEVTVTADSAGAWAETSFDGEGVDVSDNFIVVYTLQTDVTSASGNCVRFALKQSSSFENSLFYEPSDASWTYYGTTMEDNLTYIFMNRIRAYVSIVTGIEDDVIEATPKEYTLNQNYPNPFNPTTTISYSLPEAGNVQLKIYDLMGREIKSLLDEEKAAGSYNVKWDGTNQFGQKVASGIYFYRVKAGKFAATKKMIMLK